MQAYPEIALPRSPSYVVRGYQGDREAAARLLFQMGPFATQAGAKKAAQVQADAAKRGVKVYVEPVGTVEVEGARANPGWDESHAPFDATSVRQAYQDGQAIICGASSKALDLEAALALVAREPITVDTRGVFFTASASPTATGCKLVNLSDTLAHIEEQKARPRCRHGRYFEGPNTCQICWDEAEYPVGDDTEDAEIAAALAKAPRRANPLPVLPEAPWRYFQQVAGAVLLRVSSLVPTRARGSGIENAARYMRMAYDGEMERRKPISVASLGDGRYSVCDGNSTFANAVKAGWTRIAAVVVDACEAEGGHAVPNPAVTIRSHITEASYPAIFGKSPRGIPEVDDPHGHFECDGPACDEQIEETSLANQFRLILHTRDAYMGRMEAVKDMLRELAPTATVLGRVKTPYSLIQKLFKSFVAQPGKGFKMAGAYDQCGRTAPVPLQLKDMAGTKIVARDRAELDHVRDALRQAFAGKVIEYEDKYAEEEAAAAAGRQRLGYNAYHLVVMADGLPVEIIMQTKRIEELGHASHDPYKNGRLNLPAYIKWVDFVNAADQGDRAAAAKVDPLLATDEGQHRIEQEITLAHANPRPRLNPTEPDVILEVSDPEGWSS